MIKMRLGNEPPPACFKRAGVFYLQRYWRVFKKGHELIVTFFEL